MSDAIYLSKDEKIQEDRHPGQSDINIPVMDPLRRDFITECLTHVARMAETACHAVAIGEDRLYEIQIEMMRATMREAIRTYNEIKRAP